MLFRSNLIVELALQLRVGVNVHFLPGESAARFQAGQGGLDLVAEVAVFAGIEDDFAHQGILTTEGTEGTE